MADPDRDADLYRPLDAGTVRDPYPIYARLRKAGPVLWHGGMRCWLVTSREHAIEVLSDNATFARDWRRAGKYVPEDLLSVQNLDPPEAVPVRSACRRFLNAPEVREQLTTRIGSLVVECLQRRASGEAFDLITEVVNPVGRELVARVLGNDSTPQSSVLTDIVDGITLGMDAGLASERRGEAERCRSAFNDVITRAVAQTPQHELLSRLLRELSDAQSSQAVALNSVRVVVLSLYAAVTGAIANAASTVLKRSTEASADLSDATPHGFVDELLRFDNVVQATTRVATRTTVLAGQTIRAGEDVTILIGAANRDPAAFPEADTLCPRRSPNPHLSFSHGAHLCLGPDLGREIVTIFLRALGDARFAVDAAGPASFLPTATMRRINFLPVHVRSGRS